MSGTRRATGIIGIIGGMGPAATADLFEKIIRATPARSDQDHVRVLIDSNPQIPSRADFLRGEGPDPSPALAATARILELAGADLLLIACSTAHLFYQAVERAVAVPVLHMMHETARYAAKTHPAIRRVGILATPGTVRAGLYQRELAQVGLEALVPDPADQDELMAALTAIKAGETAGPKAVAARVAGALADRGAEALIAGCTELPLVLAQADVPVPLIDATQVLAEVAVRRATARDLPQ